MNYIVFDLEFNQDLPSLQASNRIGKQINSSVPNKKGLSQYPFEIIQIGAIKLDSNFSTIATFNRYIKPTIYTKISPFITELTKITTEQLMLEESFDKVYESYVEFIGETDSLFCIWGMADVKALYKNAEYHQLNTKLLPRMFINIQPHVSIHLSFPQKHLLRLQTAVELLGIPITYEFHNALYDSFYTAELFKRIYNSSIHPNLYDPSYIFIRPRQQKKIINFDKLIHQFEKIYARSMTQEEQAIIMLAYKMGKTSQFVEYTK